MTLDARLAALDRAAHLAEGRLDEAAVQAAREVAGRAGARLGLGVGTTVAALAGPTGAGKSSLFNALAGRELVRAGVRRPTTSATSAAVWGAPTPDLLDWVGARERHVLGEAPGRAGGDLVLLDLPDFDSVEAANRTEVDRVVALADLLVWVTDPQKYADAAMHEGYLRPLAGHGAVMAVVLNQADRLAPEALAACRTDLGRLLAEDGLDGVPVLAVSATRGDGLADLHALLAERAAARSAAVARLAADVARVARALEAGCEPDGRRRGRRGSPDVPDAARARLSATLAEAAGVPAVADAVAAAHRRRGALVAGWPPVRWLRRLRPDPLRRLRIGDVPSPGTRTSLPAATPVQRARVGSALRALAGDVAGELPAPWPALVRRAATAEEEALAGALDRAVAGTSLPQRTPRWWALAGLAQRVLAVVALAGGAWLAALAVLGLLRLDAAVPLPEVEGVPVPTLALVGGLAAGLLLAVLARRLTAIGAARRARRARRALEREVDAVAEERVLASVRAELAVREELCGALADSVRGA